MNTIHYAWWRATYFFGVLFVCFRIQVTDGDSKEDVRRKKLVHNQGP